MQQNKLKAISLQRKCFRGRRHGEGEETSKIVDTISCYELVKTGKASKSKSKSGIF
jgi:hypothetical protein